MLKAQEATAMASSSEMVDSVRNSVCFQSLLGFFFNKGVRGGPRVLLNLAGVLVALFIFVKLIPQRMTDSMTESALQNIPQSVWNTLGIDDDGSRPGGLRVVVFGEIDIGTPLGLQDEVKDAKSWTQALCDQLGCSSHISMVPAPDASSWSLSSNEIYAKGIEKVFNETADKNGPGQDYSFLSSQFAPQWKAADLKAQVDEFLARPQPRYTSAETLWVFSFGMWDVWSLSSLPVNTAKDLTGEMTKDIYVQIERLYTAAMDPKSIAYSDVTRAHRDAAEAAESADQASSEPAPSGDQLEARDEPAVETLELATDPEPKEPNSFRILMPRMVDPSVLPGWRDLRPQTPPVHNKAEQMRNAAALTKAWNDGIEQGLGDWVQKKDEDDPSLSFLPTDEAAAAAAAKKASRPLRDGYAYNLADYILEQLANRQLRNAHLSDGKGRGAGALEDGFHDVRNSCLQPLDQVSFMAAPVSGSMLSHQDNGRVDVNIPNQRVAEDKQVPKRPVADAGLQPSAAEDGGVKRRSTVGSRDTGKDGTEGERREGLAYMDTAHVCDIPSDYLFYTPFALSQRAINEVASEIVDMVRKGETVRSKIAAAGH